MRQAQGVRTRRRRGYGFLALPPSGDRSLARNDRQPNGASLSRSKPSAYDACDQLGESLGGLVTHQGQVYTREQLLKAVWSSHTSDGTRTADVHVRCLREKLESDPANPVRLRTVRGMGYRFVAPDGLMPLSARERVE